MAKASYNSQKPAGWHPDDHRKYVEHLRAMAEHSSAMREWGHVRARHAAEGNHRAAKYAESRQHYHSHEATQNHREVHRLNQAHGESGRGWHPVTASHVTSGTSSSGVDKKYREAHEATKE